MYGMNGHARASRANCPQWRRIAAVLLAAGCAGATERQAAAQETASVRAIPGATVELPASVEVERSAGLLRHADREGPAIMGFGRDLDALTGAPVGPGDFVWETAPDGAEVAAVVLVSPGAAGIRAQLLAKNLPEDLRVGFYDPRDVEGTVEWVSAGELTATPSPDGNGHLYWSPTVGGDRIGIELRIPYGEPWRWGAITIPRISHLDQTPRPPRALAQAGVRPNRRRLPKRPNLRHSAEQRGEVSLHHGIRRDIQLHRKPVERPGLGDPDPLPPHRRPLR